MWMSLRCGCLLVVTLTASAVWSAFLGRYALPNSPALVGLFGFCDFCFAVMRNHITENHDKHAYVECLINQKRTPHIHTESVKKSPMMYGAKCVTTSVG